MLDLIQTTCNNVWRLCVVQPQDQLPQGSSCLRSRTCPDVAILDTSENHGSMSTQEQQGQTSTCACQRCCTNETDALNPLRKLELTGTLRIQGTGSSRGATGIQGTGPMTGTSSKVTSTTSGTGVTRGA